MSLPPTIGSFPGLVTLNISHNNLRKLPEEIGGLSSLEKLDISANRLTHLPASFRSLGTTLVHFFSAENPWICPRASICDAGPKAVMAELARMATTRADSLNTKFIGLTNGLVDTPLRFGVLACDASAAPRMSGKDEIQVTISGPGAASTKVIDNGDGTYVVEASVKAPGKYTIRGFVSGIPMAQGPMIVPFLPENEKGNRLDELSEITVEGNDYLDSFNMGRGESTFAHFPKLLKFAREFNVSPPVPEVVICGTEHYTQLGELLWGIYPLDLAATAKLRRPLFLSLMFNEEAKEPRVTIKRDRLLGSNVSGGMRDMTVTLDALPEMLEQRNQEHSAVPVMVVYEYCKVLTCNVYFAPEIPEFDDPHHAVAEEILFDLISQPNRTIVCLQSAVEWPLFQTSPWMTRIMSVDEKLSRSIFVFSQFSSLLQSAATPRDIKEFVCGRPKSFPSFFVTLPSAEVRAACKSAEEYKKFLWQLALHDRATLNRMGFEKQMDEVVGAKTVRRELFARIVNTYQKQAPLLEQRVAALATKSSATLTRAQSQIEALSGDKLPGLLRLAVSNYTLKFGTTVSDLLHGSMEGRNTGLGQTFQEELQELQEHNPLFFTSEGMSTTSCRFYGGAQLVRALENFTVATANVKVNRQITAETLHDILPPNVNIISAASQIAQREAIEAMTPLIEQLCAEASYLIQRTSGVADAILAPHAKQAPLSCSKNELLDHLTEFSYLQKNVKELFMEIVDQRLTLFKTKCYEDFNIPTTHWDLPSISLDELGGPSHDVHAFAMQIYQHLVTRVSESITTRFYNLLLRSIVTEAPEEMHSSLMSLQDKHLSNLFQLESLKQSLTQELEQSKATLADYDDMKVGIRAIQL